MLDLTKKKCTPCEGGTKPFDKKEAEKHLKLLTTKWELVDPSTGSGQEMKIRRRYKFDSFGDAIKFINKVAKLAEIEDHHPNIFNSYTKVTLTLTTHSVGGLSINDFIMAAKIDDIS